MNQKSETKGDICIGIDLGTTNSCVAIMDGSTPTVIVNAEGTRTTPSVVAYDDGDGGRKVGIPAKRQAVAKPEQTIFSSKSFIGRTAEEGKKLQSHFPFAIVEGKNGAAAFNVNGKVITPEEVGAAVLAKMKETAEAHLGRPVKRAVVTVPAYFDDAQRQSTIDAGRIAGLTVERIINEPTAAALAYGLEKGENKKIAVYDLGGGTFDISILELGDGVFEVLSTNGDTQLGGDNFDLVIMDWIIDGFKKAEGIDLRQDKMALQRVRDAAEKAKIELSSTNSTEINQPFITMDATGPKHLQLTLNRATFEQIAHTLVERTRQPCLEALKDAKLSASDINEVILVGGMTRMPAVQEICKTLFQREPHRGVNPDEVVAIGAAIQGAVLTGDVKDVLLLDVIPLSLGIETMGGVMTKIVEKNTTIPTQKKMTFSTAADNQPAVTIKVLQGERPMANDNKVIATFDLVDIPPAPRGVPQIEVAFDISADGTLNVSAEDKSSGKRQEVRVERSSQLSDVEIDRMINEAEKFKEEDQRKAQEAQLVNEADSLAFQAQKSLNDYKDKLPKEVQEMIQKDVDLVKKALEEKNMDAIKSAKENLEKNMQKIGEHLSKGQTAQPQSPQQKEEDVEEADVEIVDEKETNDDA